MLQLFVDDSKQQEDVLVLAGYAAHPLKWAQLSVEWQRLLDENPRWSEFKMNKAARYPERAQRFYQVVKDHVAVYFACVVEIAPLRRLCDEFGLHNPFWINPYNFAIKAILDATYTEMGEVDLQWPIEFIFDERGEKVHVRSAWEFFLIGRSPEARRLIPAEPRFEDSRKVLQLQTAEIIAWHARKHWMKHKRFEGKVELLWDDPDPIGGRLIHWDYDALKPNIVSQRKLLLEWGHPLPPIR
jgi:hypothetical protein